MMAEKIENLDDLAKVAGAELGQEKRKDKAEAKPAATTPSAQQSVKPIPRIIPRIVIKKQKTALFRFRSYKKTNRNGKVLHNVGWSLQLWYLKIRWNIQDSYTGLYLEIGPYNII